MKSRRGFLKALAVVPVVPGALGRQNSALPAEAPATAGASASVEEALAEAIRRQFGAHLDAAELEEVRRELERNRAAAGRLRAAARLANADDLVTRFEARPPVPATPVGRGVTR
jgi:GAF domain-containing protein